MKEFGLFSWCNLRTTGRPIPIHTSGAPASSLRETCVALSYVMCMHVCMQVKFGWSFTLLSFTSLTSSLCSGLQYAPMGREHIWGLYTFIALPYSCGHIWAHYSLHCTLSQQSVSIKSSFFTLWGPTGYILNIMYCNPLPLNFYSMIVWNVKHGLCPYKSLVFICCGHVYLCLSLGML